MNKCLIPLLLAVFLLSCTRAVVVPEAAVPASMNKEGVLRVTDIHGRRVESRVQFIRADTLYLVSTVPLGARPDTVAVALSDIQKVEQVRIDRCRTRWLVGTLTAACCLFMYLLVLFFGGLSKMG